MKAVAVHTIFHTWKCFSFFSFFFIWLPPALFYSYFLCVCCRRWWSGVCSRTPPTPSQWQLTPPKAMEHAANPNWWWPREQVSANAIISISLSLSLPHTHIHTHTQYERAPHTACCHLQQPNEPWGEKTRDLNRIQNVLERGKTAVITQGVRCRYYLCCVCCWLHLWAFLITNKGRGKKKVQYRLLQLLVCGSFGGASDYACIKGL